MALPQSRYEFKDYCLRRMGAPTIQINVDDLTVEDCIDYALRKFMDYHFDGTDKVYYKHIVSEENIATQSITLPDNIIGAVNVFSGGFGSQTGNWTSLDYQLTLQTLYSYTSNSLLPYYMTQYQLQSLDNMLNGVRPIRYNRYKNTLKIDTNWNKFEIGNYLIVEAYEVVDPEEFGRLWQEPWLIDYTCAQIGIRWGKILTRYQGMTLPNGLTFNGDRILTDAQIEAAKLEDDLINKYSYPPMDMIG